MLREKLFGLNRSGLFEVSTARDRLLGMLNEYDEREREHRNNPSRVPGEALCAKLRQRLRGCRGDNFRIVLGWNQYRLLFDYAICQKARYGSKEVGGSLCFQGIPCQCAGDGDYIGVFRVLPYQWVEVTG